jgi:hypothetical protein
VVDVWAPCCSHWVARRRQAGLRWCRAQLFISLFPLFAYADVRIRKRREQRAWRSGQRSVELPTKSVKSARSAGRDGHDDDCPPLRL